MVWNKLSHFTSPISACVRLVYIAAPHSGLKHQKAGQNGKKKLENNLDYMAKKYSYDIVS